MLSTLNTSITVSGNPWTYVSNDGLTYRYLYTKTGSETSRLVVVHGYDLAGNNAWNNTNWEKLRVSGYDLYDNYGEKVVTVNVNYGMGE